MLREIETLLRERGPMRTIDLAIHLNTEPTAVDGMLTTLESKGRVEKVTRDEHRSEACPESCGKEEKPLWLSGCANCSLCRKDEAAYWRIR